MDNILYAQIKSEYRESKQVKTSKVALTILIVASVITWGILAVKVSAENITAQPCPEDKKCLAWDRLSERDRNAGKFTDWCNTFPERCK